MVDELASPAVDAAEAFLLRDTGCQVPQPVRVADVLPVETDGVELGPGRATQDLGGRGRRLVIEVPGQHQPPGPAGTSKQIVHQSANGDRLRGAAVQRVGGVAGAFCLI